MPPFSVSQQISDSARLVAATVVAVLGRGVLLFGPSGAGKSDLALRLIDGGGELVADDQVILEHGADQTLIARPPAAIAGLLEVRGLGLLRLPYCAAVPLALAVDLTPGDKPERLPEVEFIELPPVRLPLLRLGAFDVSAAARIRARLCHPLAETAALSS